LEREYPLSDLLKRPDVSYSSLVSLKKADGNLISPQSLNGVPATQVEIEVKYEGYVARQRQEIEKHLSHETTRIPSALVYAEVKGLSKEVLQKLEAGRPETLGQASRLSGVTPAAISLLIVHIKKLNLLLGQSSSADRSVA
jgi:tRNA uridine 5-carboxymethylaminomethyl modification enzyme